MKSIVIIGKGTSILRCKKELIDSFDEVAIINRPIYEGYDHLISNHADWDFTNNDAPQYSKKWQQNLGIKKHIDTSENSEFRNKYWKWFKDNYFKIENIDDINKYGQSMWHIENQMGPSNGIMVFEYFVRQNDYNKIGLMGFDLMQKGKRVYYFNEEKAFDSIKYLWNNGTYDRDNIYLKNSMHDLEITYSYLIETFRKNKDKEFHLLSDYDEFKNEKLNNLILY